MAGLSHSVGNLPRGVDILPSIADEYPRHGAPSVFRTSALIGGKSQARPETRLGLYSHWFWSPGVKRQHVIECGLRLVAVDHEGGCLSNELDQHHIACSRLARLAMIHGERTEHLPAPRHNGRRPAGAKAILKGAMFELRPKRVRLDVDNEHGRTKISGSAARTV
jgi:hypothetical protein